MNTTDPDARLARKGKGKEAKLSYQANALMENRNGLLVAVEVCHATGTSEREGALRLIDKMFLDKDCTLGADRGYDTREFVAALHDRGILPHIARNTAGRRSAISNDIAGSTGYAVSQQIRKRIEQPFGWSKVFGGLRKLMRVGLPDVKAWTLWVFAAYNLVRIGGLEDWWQPGPT
jgi:hypothetical protein